MKSNNALIPANPGFFLLEPVENSNGTIVEIVLIPIIAWQLGDQGEIYPISMIQRIDDADQAIKDCNGVVHSPFGDVYDSVEDWIDEKNKAKEKKSHKPE